MFHWYLGRVKIKPIYLDNEGDLLELLEESATQIQKNDWWTSRWIGLFDSGHSYHVKGSRVLMKYEPKYLFVYWYFRGQVVRKGDSVVLTGYFKSPAVYEVVKTIVLLFIIYSALMLPYLILLGQEVAVFDFFLVFVGFPLFLLMVRALLQPLPWVGVQSMSKTKNFLAKLENERSRRES